MLRLVNSKNEFKQQIEEIEKINFEYHVKRKIFKINEIKEVIKKISQEDWNFFGIQEIYLYGSYAKNRMTDYSDIDIHIILNKHREFIDEQSSILTNYFSNLFNSKVDVSATFFHDVLDEQTIALFNKEIKIG